MTFVEGKALRLARGGPLSLGIAVKVGQAATELLSLVTLAEPYPPLQENVKVEATVRGINPAGRLKLEFWADMPSGAFEELAVVETRALDAGEIAHYAAEVVVREAGAYTIYAYLYDGAGRIGRKVEHIYVE